MTGATRWGRSRRTLAVAVALGLGCALAPRHTAFAAPAEFGAPGTAPPLTHAFDGGHMGVLFGVGLSSPGSELRAAGAAGLDLRLALRAATPLQIIDAEVAWDGALRRRLLAPRTVGAARRAARLPLRA